MLSPEEESAALALVELSRSLYGRGWMEGTSGNVSVRLPGGRTLITASGRSKGRLTVTDVVVVDALTGRPAAAAENGVRPSAETLIHLALYRRFPDCGAVVHVHSPYATLAAARAAATGQQAVRFAEYELIKGFGIPGPARTAVPVFVNWRDVALIASDVDDFYATDRSDLPTVLLIAHHGATAWGADLDTARNRLECLEELCRLEALAMHIWEGARQ